jgi:hypothetical protein
MTLVHAHYPENPPDRCIACWSPIFHAPDSIYPGDPAVYVGGAWYHAVCYRNETGLPKMGRRIPWPVAWTPLPMTPLPHGEAAKDPLAVELGRRGGLKGGKARAAKLSAAERKAIATKAARARWGAA